MNSSKLTDNVPSSATHGSDILAQRMVGRLRCALEDISRLGIERTRGTSAEFAAKRLQEAVAIARDALKSANERLTD